MAALSPPPATALTSVNGRGGSDGSITIHGGSITANGSTGIGGGSSDTIITINDGFIIANGSTGAGIGGGMADRANGGGYGGDIIITGGSVTAISKKGGAGIGGGNGGNGGYITIRGGSIIAVSEEYGSEGGARLSEPKIKFITRKFCKKYVNVTFIFSPLQIAMYMKKQRITPIFTFLPPSVTARSVLQCLLNRVLS